MTKEGEGGMADYQRLADVARSLAHDASALVREWEGRSPRSVRAVAKMREHADAALVEAKRLASGPGHGSREEFRAALWALETAAVAVSQARESVEQGLAPRP